MAPSDLETTAAPVGGGAGCMTVEKDVEDVLLKEVVVILVANTNPTNVNHTNVNLTNVNLTNVNRKH